MTRSTTGFTLLELMIVIAIAAILATTAVPAMRDLLLNSARTSLTNELLASLQLARSEAIKRGRTVRVCPSTNGSTCSTSRSDWNEGWLVIDGAGQTIQAMRNEARITTVSADRDDFSFQPFPPSADEGNFTICDTRGGSQARRVEVRPSGRSRVVSPDDGEGAISCPA